MAQEAHHTVAGGRSSSQLQVLKINIKTLFIQGLCKTQLKRMVMTNFNPNIHLSRDKTTEEV